MNGGCARSSGKSLSLICVGFLGARMRNLAGWKIAQIWLSDFPIRLSDFPAILLAGHAPDAS
jgi:hypothetical protein